MALNIAECVTLQARRDPDAVAIVLDDVQLSFGALLHSAQRVAAFLHRAGLKRGDHVAILLPNTPHFPIIYYGILYAGGVAVPMNPLQTPREYRYLFGDANPTFLFVWADLAAPVMEALSPDDAERALIVVESDQTPLSPPMGRSFLSELSKPAPVPAMAETNPDDVAVIMYTAGYRGKPLGAQLTHFNVFQNALSVGTRLLHFTEHDRCLCALPLFHSFGQCVMMNAALLAGACLVLVPRFDATRVLEVVEREKLTVMALVPTMYQFLLGTKATFTPDLSSLRHVLVGGAPLSVETVEAFKARFGFTILEGYGLTETSPVVSFNMSVEDNRPGSVGVPLWGCEVRVVDEAGQPVPPGVTGEVVVRGHNVMKGYLGHPEITAQTIVDGWLHTGDWGSLDEDGYIYLKGLKKDMLIRAGLNVYPREIEMVLEEHPLVKEAGVIGIPDTVRGEEVQVFVVATEVPDDLEKQLKQHCRAFLAGYKCPRNFEIIDVLPRKEDGTIDKVALRNR